MLLDRLMQNVKEKIEDKVDEDIEHQLEHMGTVQLKSIALEKNLDSYDKLLMQDIQSKE
jgi:hypothetical protein